MKKLLTDQRGVTLIETVAATAIIMIIMISVLGALLYGQKMIVFSDSKNNEAAQAQELVDNIMKLLPGGASPGGQIIADANNVGNAFKVSEKNLPPKQYYIVPVGDDMNPVVLGAEVGYKIYVRVYYNKGESYIDLKAFSKRMHMNSDGTKADLI